jgi:hypothetical protein
MSDTERKSPELAEHLKGFAPGPINTVPLGREMLISLLPEAMVTGAVRFTEGLLAARDRDWILSVKKIEVAQWRLGMEDATKLVCTICAKGEKPVGRKDDDKAMRVWVHAAPSVDREATKPALVRCTAAAIYEIMEPKA